MHSDKANVGPVIGKRVEFTGIEHIEDIRILRLDPFRRIGAPLELVGAFGGRSGYDKAIHELEDQLYG